MNNFRSLVNKQSYSILLPRTFGKPLLYVATTGDILYIVKKLYLKL